MQGKICLITGANRGIGRAAATELAKMGATVLLVCRTKEIAEQTRSEISAATGNKKLQAYGADFSVQAEVRKLVSDIIATQPRLDVLINNAGIYSTYRRTTVDKVELTFATNHLAPFILTNGLTELLKQSAPSRVIIVGSEAHHRVRDPEDWESTGSYNGALAYSRSKLANVMYSYDLAHRLEGTGVSVNCVHPGFVKTNILQSRFDRWWNSWFWAIFMNFLITPEEGAKGLVYLATSPEVEGVTGKYYNRTQPSTSSLISHDAVIGARLWNISLRMVGELPPVEITGEHIAH